MKQKLNVINVEHVQKRESISNLSSVITLYRKPRGRWNKSGFTAGNVNASEGSFKRGSSHFKLNLFLRSLNKTHPLFALYRRSEVLIRRDQIL